jgi:hypothetical protein
MISNTDCILFVYSTWHIRVKVYKDREPRQRFQSACEEAVRHVFGRCNSELWGLRPDIASTILRATISDFPSLGHPPGRPNFPLTSDRICRQLLSHPVKRMNAIREICFRKGTSVNINDAQRDVRTVFLGGFAGQLVSGLIWLVSAATWRSPKSAIIAVVGGGFFIFPLTQLLCG